MNNILRAVLAIAVLCAATPATAGDAFLVIDGVAGGSGDSQFRGAIEVESYSGGHEFAAGASRATFRPLVVFKKIDIATPTLAALAATGQTIKTATLSLRRPGSNGSYFVYHTIALRDVSLRGFAFSGNGSTAIQNEQFTLQYNAIEWTFVPITATGTPGTPVTTRWDLVNNKFY